MANTRPKTRKNYPDPDDLTLRVVLSDEVRRELANLPRKEVAAAVRSSRTDKESVAASTISRLIHGAFNPTRRMARRLAEILGRDPLEVASGWETPHPMTHWGAQVMYKRGGFRERTVRLMRSFAPLLDETMHFDMPHDRERQLRRVVHSARATFEYQVFAIETEVPLRELAPLDFVLSNRIFAPPTIFFDYGILEIDLDVLRIYEIWMRRYQVIELPAGARRIWVEVWNDGGDVPSLVRSSRDFSLVGAAEPAGGLKRMLPADPRPDGASPLAMFPAGGLQTKAPYTRIQVVADG